MYKKISMSLVGAITTVAMLLTPISALAAPVTGTNITSQTIPVKAVVETAYVIGVPANLDGDGNLNLTRDYNAYITSDGDTNGTFYGYTSLSMSGVIANGKKVKCDLSAANLVKTGDASKTAALGMQTITDAQAAKAAVLWNSSSTAEQREAAKLPFGSSAWSVSTSTSPAITINFASAEVNESTPTLKSAMLRTTLPTDGTYTSNLVVDFALVNAD